MRFLDLELEEDAPLGPSLVVVVVRVFVAVNPCLLFVVVPLFVVVRVFVAVPGSLFVPLFVVVRVFVAVPGSLLVVGPVFVIVPFVVGPVFVVVVVVFVVNPGPLRCDTCTVGSMGSFGGSSIILRSSNSTENSRSALMFAESLGGMQGTNPTTSLKTRSSSLCKKKENLVINNRACM